VRSVDGEWPEALYYLDIALDFRQLRLFWQKGLFGYLVLNVAGMALPPVFTALEAIHFLDRPSPEQDQLKKMLAPKMLVPAMLLAILSQTHVLLLAAASALSRRTPGLKGTLVILAGILQASAAAAAKPVPASGDILCLQEPSMQRQAPLQSA